MSVADKIEEWFHGRHRQAAAAVQGDPADRAGGADARTAADRAATRALISEWANSPAGRAYARATSGAGAGVMALMPRVYTAALCQVCNMPGAGPGGICSACAATSMGAGTMAQMRSCPQCGKAYSTGDAACPSCLAKMIQAMNVMQAAAALSSIGGITGAHPFATPATAPPEPLPRADMQVRDLIGWRVWRITSLGYLRSLTADAIWLPGVPMEAPSVVDSHDASKTGGSDLGIHVFAERNGAILGVEKYIIRSEQRVGYAIGSVLLWGEVVEHERGYRAERAKIKSIDDVTWKGKPPWDRETAEGLGFLRARYGVASIDKESASGE